MLCRRDGCRQGRRYERRVAYSMFWREARVRLNKSSC